MKVLFRADASRTIGTGHVMRCLALAESLIEAGAEVAFACAEITETIFRRLAAAGIVTVQLDGPRGGLQDCATTIRLARSRGADWVVLDGYDFDAGYHSDLRSAGLRVLSFDDSGAGAGYGADLLVNPNLFADPSWYRPWPSGSRMLLGPRYAPLRREFAAWREWRREHPPRGHRVLVTLGGAGSTDVILTAFDALALVKPPIGATVLLGSSNPDADRLAKQARQTGLTAVMDPDSMAACFAQADIALAAGGTTALELAFMGLPAVLLVTAENQRPVVATMAAANLALAASNADSYTIAALLDRLAGDCAARREISERGRRLVDGRGAERVARAMKATNEVSLVPAGPEHRRLIWEWANDPEARRASISRDVIPWDDHERWYDDRLNRRRMDLFVVLDRARVPVGQVRLELRGKRGYLSLNVAPRARRKGLGRLIVDVGVGRLFDETEVEAVDVHVRPENEASLRVFRSVDFVERGEVVERGQRVIHLERRRDPLPVAAA